MKIKILAGLLMFTLLGGCASTRPGFPIEGTKTAVVKISVSKRGLKVDRDPVFLEVNQRVVFVGPDEFIIDFPEGSPFDKDKFEVSNAVLSLDVPEQVKSKFKQDAEETRFKYNVTVGGQVLDPHLVIKH